MRGNRRTGLVAAFFIAALVSGLAAAEPDPGDFAPLQFYRARIPAEHFRKFVRGTVPVPAEEFEAKQKELRASWQTAGGGARIAKATYFARLSGEHLVDGQAVWEVAHVSDQPSMLLLGACGLPLGEGVWEGSPRRRASMGLDAGGRLVLLVDRPSTLRVPWTLNGTAQANGDLLFQFAAPPCASNQIVLDLPAHLRPIAEECVVTEFDVSQLEQDPFASVGMAPNDRSNRWLLQFGRRESLDLRLTAVENAAQFESSLTLRNSHAYRLTLSGLELTRELSFYLDSSPLRELTCDVVGSLVVTNVSLSDAQSSVTWRQEKLDGSPASGQLHLRFSDPVAQSGKLRISAMAPLQAGEKWTLPRIQPRGGYWQEGVTTIQAVEPLTVRELRTQECQQTSVRALPEPNNGTEIEIQEYSPAAAVQATVAPRPAELQVAAGESVEFGPSTLTARIRADLKAARPNRFQIQLALAAGWIVDSIDTEPAEISEPWESASLDNGESLITIPLRRPVPALEHLRITIVAHRRLAGEAEMVDGSNLRVVRFLDAVRTRSVVSVDAAAPHRLRVRGDVDLARLDPQQLPQADADLVDSGPESLVFIDGPAANSLQLSLDDEPPSYSAEVEVDAAVGARHLTESYRIVFKPSNTALSALQIRLSHARASALQWTLDGESDAIQASQRTTIDHSEVWEIRLARPRRVRFELRASRQTELSGKTPVSLASVPAAASQVGAAAVRTLDGTAVRVDAGNLDPLPAVGQTEDQYSDIRARFRYEPLHDFGLTVQSLGSAGPQASAWVWRSGLTTFVQERGELLHSATLKLENTGRKSVNLTLPPSATVRRITVDGSEIAPPAGRARSLSISLPDGVRFPAIRVLYTSPAPALSLFGVRRVSAAVVAIDAPVLDFDWVVKLPPHLAPLGRLGPDLNAHSAMEALLGPLAGKRRPFTFSFSDGASNEGPWSAAAQLAGQLDDIAAEIASRKTDGSPTWRELLQELVVRRDDRGTGAPPLLVDRAALRRQGLNPATAAPSLNGGGNLLRSAGLAVIAHPDGLILTSVESLLLNSDVQQRTAGANVAATTSARGGERMGREIDAGEAYISINAWLAETDKSPPWLAGDRIADSPLAATEWTAVRVKADRASLETGLPAVRVYSRSTVRALAWSAALVFAGLAWRLAAQHPVRLAVLVVVAGAAALFSPPFAQVVGAGMFLGALAVTLVECVKPRRAAGALRPDIENSAVRRLTASSLAVFVTGALLSAATAAEPVNGPPTAADDVKRPVPQTYRVLIPVDEDQQPTGSYWYVDQELWSAINRRIAAASAAPDGWLIRSADYRAALGWDNLGAQLIVEEMIAEFVVETLQPEIQVTLPVGDQQRRVILESAELDGEPIIIDPARSDEQGIVLVASAAGEHRLQLRFRVAAEKNGAAIGFETAIPQVPNSRLTVQYPADAPPIELQRALGAVERDDAANRISAQLGPVGKIAVRWPGDHARMRDASTIGVTELYWLNVRPQSVTLDAVFKLAAPNGGVSNARLLVDPRLRLLNLEADASIAEQNQFEEDGLSAHELRFAEPLKNEATVKASFHFTDAAGVGALRMPRIGVATELGARRRLALSIASDLAYSATTGESVRSIPVSEFLAGWGESAETPQYACELLDDPTHWSVTTRRATPTIAAVSRTDVSVRPRGTDVRFQADLEVASGPSFQFQVQSPRKFVLRNALLTAGDERIPVSVFHSEEGLITVRSQAGVTGKCRLSMSGTIALDGEEPASLPKIHLVDTNPVSSTIRVFRRSGVTAEIESHPGLASDSTVETGLYLEGLGRLLYAFEVEPDALPDHSYSARLAIRPISTRASGQLITSIRRRDERWLAEVDLEINVTQGLLDAVRLEIPAPWGDSLALEPEVDSRIVVLPGANRRHLLIRPTQAISGQFQTRLVGELDFQADGLRAPDVVLLDIETTDHFVVLPLADGEQSIQWDLSGLQSAAAPISADRQDNAPEAMATYRVVDRQFRARIEGTTRVEGRLRIGLADIYAVLQEKAVRGLAAFDLDPAGRKSCVLRLPPKAELTHVRIAGAPAMLDPLGKSRWLVSLAHDRLPQRVEVLFQQRLDAPLAEPAWLLESPVIEDAVVARTLWTIHGDELSGVWSASLPGASSPRLEFLRLEAAMRTLERGAEVIADHPAPDVTAAWHQPWSSRVSDLRRRLDFLRQAHPRHASAVVPELEPVDELLQAVDAQLESLQSRGQLTEPAAVSDFSDRWRFEYDRAAALQQCAVDGAAPSLRLSQLESQPGLSAPAVVMLSLPAILLITFLVRPVRRALVDWAWQWPFAVIVLIGATWWLLLSPSWLGLAIVAAGVVVSMRRPWSKTRAARRAVPAIR